MKSNSRPGLASLDRVECSGPPTMLSAASPSPFSSRSALQMAKVSALISCPYRWVATSLPCSAASSCSVSSATVSIPPVPQAPSYSRYVPEVIWSAMGRKTSFAISRTASRGVQCSPASPLFSSLKRRTSSSKIVPMPWLSRPGCFTEPSVWRTGSGLRLMSGEVSFSISVPRASARDSRGI